MAILGQQDARRSLFNLEGAIERLCTFKRGKEKDKFRGPCNIKQRSGNY